MSIVVYTALFGDHTDHLWTPHPFVLGGCEHVCFSDRYRPQVGIWETSNSMKGGTGKMVTPKAWDVRVVPTHGDSRTSARHYKTLPHRYLEADVSIWVDGNVRLLITPQQAVSLWLKDGLQATFNHPFRNCLYAEALHCLKVPRARIYQKELARQTRAYRKLGMPERWGLAETRCVIRTRDPKIQELNEAWWVEIRDRSPRCQVSFPYVCWKLGLRWNPIPGRIRIFDGPGKATGPFWCIKHFHDV